MLIKWITTKAKTAPMICRQFHLDSFSGGKIAICGLGFFELYINGQKISEDLLTPVWSDYEPRQNRRMLYPLSDSFTHRVYYRMYDVTHALQPGENVIQVLLGNGWFNQRERNVEGDFWYREPMLSFTLTVQTKEGEVTVESDEACQYRESHIVFNNVYMGETHDYRDKPALWQPCLLCQPPQGILQEQTCPPDRVIRTIEPTLLWRQGDAALYDMGENITGHVTFWQNAKAGQETVLTFCENLDAQGQPNYDSCLAAQIQTDRCINGGQPVRFAPHFTWHGFRYVHITGPAEQVQGVVVHADVPVTASFASSDETLNWLYQTYLRTQLDNMHCGVPSDCPHRERLGYTGDGQLCCDAALLLLDSKEFYKKWMQDIADCQAPNGHVQHTAPFYGGGGGPGGWGGAMVIVPYMYYRHTLDRSILQQYFPHMKRWAAYMESRCENDLVTHEEPDGWCLGEWCTPETVQIAPAFVNTYFLVKNLQRMAEIASLLGEDATPWQTKADRYKTAIHQAFYQPQANTYGPQGADVFALDIGLGDDALLSRLAAHYDELGQFDTGIFGTDLLLERLFAGGKGKTALKLLSSHKEFSFGHMMDAGATTLWERWDGANSHNHPMFGACTRQLFYGILGIQPFEEQMTVSPSADCLPQKAKGSLVTRNGTIAVEYEKTDGLVYGTLLCDRPVRLILPEGERQIPANTPVSFSF